MIHIIEEREENIEEEEREEEELNMKTKYFLTIVAASIALTAVAQQSEHDNYVGVNFGGGLNSMLYKPANGTQSLGFGFDAGLHYGHFFNKTVGLKDTWKR